MRKQDDMPARNKKNFRSTKSGAGMTRAGVASYRRKNPGSKLKTAVTGKVKKGSAAAKRRKSYCARSAGQMKQFPKAAANPNSRLRQARKRWKFLYSFFGKLDNAIAFVETYVIKMTEWCWHTRVKLLNKKRKKK
jgi:hypothetical protein